MIDIGCPWFHNSSAGAGFQFRRHFRVRHIHGDDQHWRVPVRQPLLQQAVAPHPAVLEGGRRRRLQPGRHRPAGQAAPFLLAALDEGRRAAGGRRRRRSSWTTAANGSRRRRWRRSSATPAAAAGAGGSSGRGDGARDGSAGVHVPEGGWVAGGGDVRGVPGRAGRRWRPQGAAGVHALLPRRLRRRVAARARYLPALPCTACSSRRRRRCRRLVSNRWATAPPRLTDCAFNTFRTNEINLILRLIMILTSWLRGRGSQRQCISSNSDYSEVSRL